MYPYKVLQCKCRHYNTILQSLKEVTSIARLLPQKLSRAEHHSNVCLVDLFSWKILNQPKTSIFRVSQLYKFLSHSDFILHKKIYEIFLKNKTNHVKIDMYYKWSSSLRLKWRWLGIYSIFKMMRLWNQIKNFLVIRKTKQEKQSNILIYSPH